MREVIVVILNISRRVREMVALREVTFKFKLKVCICSQLRRVRNTSKKYWFQHLKILQLEVPRGLCSSSLPLGTTWYFPNVNMVFWYLSVQKSPIMMRRNSVKHYFIETYFAWVRSENIWDRPASKR